MKFNEFAKYLLKMEMGSTVRLKNKSGIEIGTFVRVPSGWVYRFIDRHGTTSCFVPYTDNLNYYDDSLDLKPCKNCNTTNVLLYQNSDSGTYYVRCESCSAQSGARKNKNEATAMWNMQN